jgi:AraC-like DNA-binding protein
MENVRLQFQVTNSNTFLAVVHQKLGGHLVSENELFFPESHPLLSGTLMRYNINEGARVLIFRNLSLKRGITLERLANTINDFLLINIYLSDAPLVQKVGEDLKILGRLNEGVFFHSSNVAFTQELPVSDTFSLINFTFDCNWMRSYLQPKIGEFFDTILQFDKTWSVYETLSSQLLHIAEQILNINMSHAMGKLILESKVNEFCYLTMRNLSTRNMRDFAAKLNHEDAKAIHATRQLLLNHLSDPPSINELAKAAAMSESKLKTCFKQVYGDSIYQHFLNYRMQKAYQIIEGREHSISEVSALLGYTNPSQFTKKFKEHFNILPNEVLKDSLV